MSSYVRNYVRKCANVRTTIEKNERKIPMRESRGLKWEKENEKS